MPSSCAVAVVSLVKRTEPESGTALRSLSPVTIHKLSITAGRFLPEQEFAWPTPARSIEFIGDSDSTCFGNLFRKTGLLDGIPHMSAHHQDVLNGFPFMIGRAFDAEINVVSRE